MNLFGFKTKKGEVLNHWITFIDGFNYPPQEFYATLEKELEERRVPTMDMSRVDFSEGGALSDKRTYLRMIRERLIFDICAAPFGRGYFFSCRGVFVPPVIKLWHIILIGGTLAIIGFLFISLLGLKLAMIAWVAFILAIIEVFQNTVRLGLSDLDTVFIKTPIIGPIYERFFRKETYFREDTRLLYLDLVPKVVKELVEDLVAAKGVKFVSQYERAPVLGELYKPPKSTIDPEPV